MKSSDPTAWGRAIRTLKCNTVYITRYRSMKIPVSFRTAYTRADKNILVDSGATDNFIDPRLIRRLRLGTHLLERARKIWNIDGTNNKAGMITNYVDLSIQTGQKQAKMRFLITDLGNEDLILGYPWLANFEPKFSWKEGAIDTSYLPIIVRSLDWETRLNRDTISRITSEPLSEQERVQIVENLEEECSLKSTISTKLAQDARQYQDKVEIPKEYQKHWKVFSEEEAHQFPPSRPWDHAIELKEGAPKAIDCKVIPTTAEEDEAQGAIGKRVHPEIQIAIRIRFLFHQKERRQVTANTRLPETQRVHDQEQVSFTPDPRTDCKSENGKHILKVRYQMGIQQCTNQGRGRT